MARSRAEGFFNDFGFEVSDKFAEQLQAEETHMQEPTIGRIVIYRASWIDSARERPAIVTSLHEDPDVVDLTVFWVDKAPTPVSSVPRIEEDDVGATGWYWPPRKEE